MVSNVHHSVDQSRRGFSLPELLVSISIILVITTILLVRYSTFNNTTLLNNQAFEMALDIRQAQVSGISARRSGTNDYDEEYGIQFSTGNDLNQQYIFFRDVGSHVPASYTDGTDTVINIFNLDPRFVISEICINSLAADCSGGENPGYLHVTFKRPNFDAILRSNTNEDVSSARITIAPVSGSNFSRTIVITPTQISVE